MTRGLQAHHQIFSKGDEEKCRDDVELALHTHSVDELFDVCVEASQVVDAKMRPNLNADVCTKKGIEHVFERQVWRSKELSGASEYMDNAFDNLQITDTDVIEFESFECLIEILTEKDTHLSTPTMDAVRFCDQIQTFLPFWTSHTN